MRQYDPDEYVNNQSNIENSGNQHQVTTKYANPLSVRQSDELIEFSSNERLLYENDAKD